MTVGEAKTASRVNTRAALPSNITASSLSGIQNCFPLGSTTFKAHRWRTGTGSPMLLDVIAPHIQMRVGVLCQEGVT